MTGLALIVASSALAVWITVHWPWVPPNLRTVAGLVIVALSALNFVSIVAGSVPAFIAVLLLAAALVLAFWAGCSAARFEVARRTRP